MHCYFKEIGEHDGVDADTEWTALTTAAQQPDTPADFADEYGALRGFVDYLFDIVGCMSVERVSGTEKVVDGSVDGIKVYRCVGPQASSLLFCVKAE
jgi:hypothetical protein